jgi:hypothetical protein
MPDRTILQTAMPCDGWLLREHNIIGLTFSLEDVAVTYTRIYTMYTEASYLVSVRIR